MRFFYEPWRASIACRFSSRVSQQTEAGTVQPPRESKRSGIADRLLRKLPDIARSRKRLLSCGSDQQLSREL